jgi:hypothetical protein
VCVCVCVQGKGQRSVGMGRMLKMLTAEDMLVLILDQGDRKGS